MRIAISLSTGVLQFSELVSGALRQTLSPTPPSPPSPPCVLPSTHLSGVLVFVDSVDSACVYTAAGTFTTSAVGFPISVNDCAFLVLGTQRQTPCPFDIRWLTAQLKVNLRPVWSPAATALFDLSQRFGDVVWSVLFTELKTLSLEEGALSLSSSTSHPTLPRDNLKLKLPRTKLSVWLSLFSRSSLCEWFTTVPIYHPTFKPRTDASIIGREGTRFEARRSYHTANVDQSLRSTVSRFPHLLNCLHMRVSSSVSLALLSSVSLISAPWICWTDPTSALYLRTTSQAAPWTRGTGNALPSMILDTRVSPRRPESPIPSLYPRL
ncbi:hypothetical protein C8R41DRAFT_915316 [Lentinula lateritia]|uniref:Uncharacterized protein n=1 Tax=Lentinula lateritia TaxID=40482 RepID=A0ABQ8VVP3_9AGAR|nr:hypothetical protein C8R41DRAFT_915316 [Lentinula lateritia]